LHATRSLSPAPRNFSRRVEAPALIARAALSPVLPPAQAERLRASIRGAELVEIPGAYRHLTLDQPQAFVEALEGFLAPLR
jgi:pimeloyl-ACP methyl ester carboxylesterase